MVITTSPPYNLALLVPSNILYPWYQLCSRKFALGKYLFDLKIKIVKKEIVLTQKRQNSDPLIEPFSVLQCAANLCECCGTCNQIATS